MSLTPVAGPVYCPDQGERDEGRVGLVLMDDALRVGIDAARSVVRGEPFEQELTERVCRVFQADAGAGITQWRRSGATVDHIERLVMSGCGLPRLSTDQLALVERAAALHPSFPPMVRGWNELRVSDSVDLRRFWRTDVYAVMQQARTAAAGSWHSPDLIMRGAVIETGTWTIALWGAAAAPFLHSV